MLHALRIRNIMHVLQPYTVQGSTKRFNVTGEGPNLHALPACSCFMLCGLQHGTHTEAAHAFVTTLSDVSLCALCRQLCCIVHYLLSLNTCCCCSMYLGLGTVVCRCLFCCRWLLHLSHALGRHQL
jgi:hypothetical protein